MAIFDEFAAVIFFFAAILIFCSIVIVFSIEKKCKYCKSYLRGGKFCKTCGKPKRKCRIDRSSIHVPTSLLEDYWWSIKCDYEPCRICDNDKCRNARKRDKPFVPTKEELEWHNWKLQKLSGRKSCPAPPPKCYRPKPVGPKLTPPKFYTESHD